MFRIFSFYLIFTFAPASSSCFLAASTSSFEAPSLIFFGVDSTKSLASLSPNPVNVRTTLRTAIFYPLALLPVLNQILFFLRLLVQHQLN